MNILPFIAPDRANMHVRQETVTLDVEPQTRYRFAVHNYSNEERISSSAAKIEIYGRDGLLDTFDVPAGPHSSALPCSTPLDPPYPSIGMSVAHGHFVNHCQKEQGDGGMCSLLTVRHGHAVKGLGTRARRLKQLKNSTQYVEAAQSVDHGQNTRLRVAQQAAQQAAQQVWRRQKQARWRRRRR